MDWLTENGFRAEIDEDGDVHFRYEGKHMYFIADDDDSYFRITMPNIYQVEKEERIQVLEACNKISQDWKLLKALVINDQLWLAVELFVDSTPNIDDFFERCCRILHNGCDDMRKLIVGE